MWGKFDHQSSESTQDFRRSTIAGEITFLNFYGPILGICAELSQFLQVLIGLVLLFFLKKGITDKRNEFVREEVPNGQGDWQFGICGCFEDMTYCAYGWCCSPWFISDLFAANTPVGFWTVLGLVVLQHVVTFVCSIFHISQAIPFIFGIAMACYLATLTSKLRLRLQLSDGLVRDCVCWYFCGCCSVIQQQRHMDKIKNEKIQCWATVGPAFGVNESLLA